jgi:hypothetical protein
VPVMRNIQGHQYSCHFPLHLPKSDKKQAIDTKANGQEPIKFNLTNPALEEDSTDD